MANQKKVMIVDDDPDVLKSVKQLLEKNGYKVFSFDNGYDCFKLLKEGIKPSLIILDIMMPIINGWQIHKKLGEHPDWRRIPIVFLTGRNTEAALDMCKKYGVEHIKKPFDIKDLKQRLENILIEREKYSKEMCKCHLLT